MLKTNLSYYSYINSNPQIGDEENNHRYYLNIYSIIILNRFHNLENKLNVTLVLCVHINMRNTIHTTNGT